MNASRKVLPLAAQPTPQERAQTHLQPQAPQAPSPIDQAWAASNAEVQRQGEAQMAPPGLMERVRALLSQLGTAAGNYAHSYTPEGYNQTHNPYRPYDLNPAPPPPAPAPAQPGMSQLEQMMEQQAAQRRSQMPPLQLQPARRTNGR